MAVGVPYVPTMAMVPEGWTSWVSRPATGAAAAASNTTDARRPSVRRRTSADRIGGVQELESECRRDGPPRRRWLRNDHPAARPASHMGHQETHRSPTDDDHGPAEQRGHPPHDVDGDRDRLRQWCDLVRDAPGHDMQPILRDRDPARQRPVPIDADEPQAGAGVRGTDVARRTRAAGQQRVDQHGPAGQLARLRDTHELVPDGEREGGPWMAAVGDVEVGATQPRVRRPDDDLALRPAADPAPRPIRTGLARPAASPWSSDVPFHRPGHLLTRAPPPRTSRSTSSSVAIEVSPGVVMASAPWAAPYSSASATGLPASRP